MTFNITTIRFDTLAIEYSMNTTLYIDDGKYYYSLLDENDTVIYRGALIIDTISPYFKIVSPFKGQKEGVVTLNITSDATEIFYRLDNNATYERYIGNEMLNLKEGSHTLSLRFVDWLYNVKEYEYTFYVGLEYTNITIQFLEIISGYVTPINNLSLTMSNEWNSTVSELQTNNNGSATFLIFPGKFTIAFNYVNRYYNFTLSTDDGTKQIIWLGKANVTITLRDCYFHNPIKSEIVMIKDKSGYLINNLITDANGSINTSLELGDYYLYYRRGGLTYSIPFQVYSIRHNYVFYIPSPLNLLTLYFKFDNGTNCYNLQVELAVTGRENITLTLQNTSQLSILASYGPLNITVTLPNGKMLTYQRIFEPKTKEMTIIIPTEVGEQWTKLPFQLTGGNFAILISTSLEYFDYYLKGGLLFAYTLFYAEIILIVLVVVFNMYIIMNNVFIETRKEFLIMRTIGGYYFHVFFAVLSRILLVGVMSAVCGYGFGGLVLIILASRNQTVFFGHTFSISLSWGIFVVNLAAIIFGVIIISVILTIQFGREKRIVVNIRR